MSTSPRFGTFYIYSCSGRCLTFSEFQAKRFLNRILMRKYAAVMLHRGQSCAFSGQDILSNNETRFRRPNLNISYLFSIFLVWFFRSLDKIENCGIFFFLWPWKCKNTFPYIFIHLFLQEESNFKKQEYIEMKNLRIWHVRVPFSREISKFMLTYVIKSFDYKKFFYLHEGILFMTEISYYLPKLSWNFFTDFKGSVQKSNKPFLSYLK